jgi:hypothetical protein
MPIEFDSEEKKRIVKEALQEWLDKQFAAFGRWTLRGLIATGFGYLVYWYLSAHGFKA